jgi:hypothetical protein
MRRFSLREHARHARTIKNNDTTNGVDDEQETKLLDQGTPQPAVRQAVLLVMLEYETEAEYTAALEKFKADGYTVY